MEHKENVWQAICVDLNIAAQGQTRQETEALIEEMVASYLAKVASLPAAERAQFLNRKAPLSVRLGWAIKFFVGSIVANRHINDRVSVVSHYHCPA